MTFLKAADIRWLRKMVKSEIVVPTCVSGKLAGAIDIESYFTSAFRADEDRQFVEACIRILAEHLEKHP